MGDYGINNSLEYTELVLDSPDASNAGASGFENSSAPANEIIYSWPEYYFTTKKFVVAGMKVISAVLTMGLKQLSQSLRGLIQVLNSLRLLKVFSHLILLSRLSGILSF